MQPPIPTHLIMGFLGVGKTTAIRHLLSRKPAGENWAVLVNEFGEIGIDGALLQQEGVRVKEVPGGCMCCVAGLPMQIGLNLLIGRDRPDRLLIEPTGLGHPAQILAVLEGQFYKDVLALGPSLCLVDPRRLQDPKVLANAHFIDQVAAADILVANKTDLCDRDTLNHYRHWALAQVPPKDRLVEVEHGRVDRELLSAISSGTRRELHHPHAHAHQNRPSAAPPPGPDLAASDWQQAANHGNEHFSLGWRISGDYRFSAVALMALCHAPEWARCKGVLYTDEGWLAINVVEGLVQSWKLPTAADNRLEIIATEKPDAVALDRALRSCLLKKGTG